ncbi:ATPase [Bacteroidia bacterium]|nr:ATPase [Bacteroidia bacterium]
MIGRKEEQEELQQILESKQSEFVAVFGRRRVGKTFLIKEFFNNKFAFYHTGIANQEMTMQLNSFNKSLNNYSNISFPNSKTWFDAFESLVALIKNKRTKGKKVIFIDEMPWMDTHKSGFLSALEWFWNSYASAQKDIILIVCGSASSWIMNKIIRNHGGLHNRVTQQIYLKPFNLAECEQLFEENGVSLSRHQILESYMIFGGIPYYLSLFQKRFGLTQNVDYLCFKDKGKLTDEFENLYASLFKNYDKHIAIVRALSSKLKGLSREDIVEITKISNGGGLSRILEELELSGFIRRYNSFEKKEKNALFQLVDFFSLFYFNFMADKRNNDEHFWTNFIENAKHRAWSGYSFELVCLSHLQQIKQKLSIAGVLSRTSAWRSNGSENDTQTQIDLLIERNDNVINLCEMKYYSGVFEIDKEYDLALQNKRAIFRSETNTNKAIHITLITTYGVKHNKYWGNIQSEVYMEDLFKF